MENSKHLHFGVNIKNKKSLLTFSDEKVFFAIRQHWLVLISSFVTTPLVCVAILFPSYFLTIWLINDVILFLLFSLLMASLCSTIILKSVIHWYFHVYIVTNHKLMEISYKPFFSEGVNEILLDLVRCTEIDIHTDGIINQLFDKGNVSITFDRPTHEEGFFLKDIQTPRKIGAILSEILNPQHETPKIEKKQAWLKTKDKDPEFIYIEDLVPQKG
jgi:hypothetical protein